MNTTIDQLQQQVKWFRRWLLLASLLLAGLGVYVLFISDAKKSIIRAKGIVIEDRLGRDRILIGSPVPASAGRVRTDTARVRKEWASLFGGDKYMKAYQSYNHEVSGILFLNDQGFDKLIVGDKTTDPNTGKRLVEPNGMTWNNDKGFEMGGIGVSKTAEGKYRTVMGMDDAETGEALHLFVLEDGTKALRIAYREGVILLGKANANSELFGDKEPFSGIKIMDNNGNILWENNALRKKPGSLQ